MVKSVLFLWLGLVAFAVVAEDATPRAGTTSQWEVKMNVFRPRFRGVDGSALLFPNLQSQEPPTVKKPSFQRSLRCRLELNSNGHFLLHPPSPKTPEDEKSHDEILPIRGKWKFHSNPYCLTDRLYDEIQLESYPRALKRRANGAEETLQRLTIQLTCRLYGRIGDTQSRAATRSMRMNHGTLLLKDELSEEPKNLFGWWKRRKICATFTAKPL
mmetsp:Transcript_7860/g.18163  ORF Transcript_7860/g.18163 Transcript_7860/m.18163 type:complete len:214 (+) Transcript_7860:185-826(+)